MKQPDTQEHNQQRPNSIEVSANEFIEAQTRQIEREFKCSMPRPRNRAMGFKGRDKSIKKAFGW